jgi:hypothetical protein
LETKIAKITKGSAIGDCCDIYPQNNAKKKFPTLSDEKNQLSVTKRLACGEEILFSSPVIKSFLASKEYVRW